MDCINHEQVISEYITFSNCFTKLIKSSTLPTTFHECQSNEEATLSDEDIILSDKESIEFHKKSVIDPRTKMRQLY